MHVKLNQPYLSIKQMKGFDLPYFAVLIDRNDVGKIHLYTGIAKKHIAVSGLSRSGSGVVPTGAYVRRAGDGSTLAGC